MAKIKSDDHDALVMAALPQANEGEVKSTDALVIDKPITKSPELQAFAEQMQADNGEGTVSLALGIVPEGANTVIASQTEEVPADDAPKAD